jgi:glucose-1-phosphate thymidylyltransferase
MKGLILAGGNGTRLYPLTQFINKHLLPISAKPMIYYPLSTMLASGITQIGLICRPQDIQQYSLIQQHLKACGAEIELIPQKDPDGIAGAILAAEYFIKDDDIFLMLGDNILFAIRELRHAIEHFQSGAHFFTTYVSEPERFGVGQIDKSGRLIKIVEKPKSYIGNGAIPGLYLYDNTLIDKCKTLNYSARGELEITDVNNLFIDEHSAKICHLPRSIPWFDAGTHEDFLEVNNYINAVERATQGLLGSPEEVALRNNHISLSQFRALIKTLTDSEYKTKLDRIST